MGGVEPRRRRGPPSLLRYVQALLRYVQSVPRARRASRKGFLASRMQDPLFWTILVFLVLGLMAAFLFSEPVQLPDTPTYVPLPGQNAFAQVNLLGNAQRPWIVTLPYALIKNDNLIVLMQSAFSLASWGALLWASSFLRIRSHVLTWTVRIIIGSIGLSSLVIQWNPLLQSDSLAMSGAVLLVAGFLVASSKKPVTGLLLLVVGALIVSQIRIITAIPIVLIAALLLVAPVRRVVRGRAGSVRSLVPVAMASCVLILIVVYGISLDNRQDIHWGNEVVPGLNIHGRTLQQVGVIDAVPEGNLAIHDILTSEGFKCLQGEFPLGKPGTYWNPTVVRKCPRQSKLFSEQFLSKYAAWILHHPRLVATSLIGPFNQGFSIPDAKTFLSLTPDSVSALWATGSSGADPVVLELGLLVAGAAWMAIRRRPGAQQVLGFTILACGGVASVIVTVIASPLDTQRVASAPAMIARLCVIFGVIIFCDRYLSSRRTNHPASNQQTPVTG